MSEYTEGAHYNTPSRHEKSLGLLTTKFVSLLETAENGILDLKVVSYVFVDSSHFNTRRKLALDLSATLIHAMLIVIGR